MKRALVVLATLVVVGALFFFFALAPITDRILNRVSGTAPAVSSAGKARTSQAIPWSTTRP